MKPFRRRALSDKFRQGRFEIPDQGSTPAVMHSPHISP
ncbi:MAG: hypothetical protein K0S58_1086 [Nitrospira sp.]|nr:hypothetical protein [Nitrospira sp.]